MTFMARPDTQGAMILVPSLLGSASSIGYSNGYTQSNNLIPRYVNTDNSTPKEIVYLLTQLTGTNRLIFTISGIVPQSYFNTINIINYSSSSSPQNLNFHSNDVSVFNASFGTSQWEWYNTSYTIPTFKKGIINYINIY